MQAPNSPYKPKNNVLFCKDPLCAFVDHPTDQPCKAPNEQCDYEVLYADYGSSLGVLVQDSFSLKFTNGSAYKHTLAFGCGYDQEFSGPFPPYVDGVLGLADGKSSIVSQLRSFGLMRNVIGHCFVQKGKGFLFFGDDLLPSGLVWAPMLPNSSNHQYTVGPVHLLFGGNTSGPEGLYVVFDSGSTYTYFNPQAYQATLSLIKTALLRKPLTAVKDKNLPVCWKGSKPFQSIDAVKNNFSPLVLSFTNAKNVSFVLPPEAYLLVTVSTSRDYFPRQFETVWQTGFKSVFWL
ncbi:hypothetical protein U1Q18_037126 [Sarracenia purpurea var. burkii]